MITCPCRECKKRTAEPNCHHPARCDAWAAYCEAKEREQAAREEAKLLDGANNLKAVKANTWHGWMFVVGDRGGRRYGERKKRRVPGGNTHVQR